MEELRADEVTCATSGKLVVGSPDAIIKSISTDSRSIKEGETFLALGGENFDGHNFIKEALAKGAEGLIISDNFKLAHLRVPAKITIKVEDTLKALGDLASYYRDKFRAQIIAITGSNGKTTLKEMVAKILGQNYRVLASPKSFNNAIGVPLTLLKLERNHQILVMEMGTNHPGEIRRLVRMARPDIGVITNIGDTHLEHFGDRWGVARAEFELFEEMHQGTAILNQDDPYLVSLRKKLNLKTITFGVKERADVMAQDIQNLGLEGVRFNLKVKMEQGEETMEVRLPILGEHNVYNALACGAIIKALNLEMDLLPEGLSDFRPPPGRSQIIEINGIKIIDDTYNANPNSVFCAIKTLAELPSVGKKICILGDMLELGQAAKFFHMELGERLAKMEIDLVFTVGEFTRLCAEQAIKGGFSEDKVFVSSDHQEALKKLGPILEEGDLLLIKGSRRMHMEQIIKGLKNKKTEEQNVN